MPLRNGMIDKRITFSNLQRMEAFKNVYFLICKCEVKSMECTALLHWGKPAPRYGHILCMEPLLENWCNLYPSTINKA